MPRVYNPDTDATPGNSRSKRYFEEDVNAYTYEELQAELSRIDLLIAQCTTDLAQFDTEDIPGKLDDIRALAKRIENLCNEREEVEAYGL